MNIKHQYKDVEQFCSTYKSDKCQNIYSDVSFLISCSGNSNNEGYIERINTLKKYVESKCNVYIPDENNKTCPIVNIMGIDGEKEEINKKLTEVVNETCKSKHYTDVTYSTFESSQMRSEPEILENLNKFKDLVFDKDINVTEAINTYGNDYEYYIMSYLKSDYCTSKQQKTNNSSQPVDNKQNDQNNNNQQNTQSSNATTLNYSIILTLVSLYFTLF